MNDVITTHHLTKTYGPRTVVDDLELRVPQGCVYGFLGPNGSGKSTTMKMLLSLARPSRGEITLLGRPMNRETRPALLREIGSLVEAPPGYAHLTGRENMVIVQRMLGLSDRQVSRAVATVRLQEHMDKLVRAYSLGMKQRLGIAMALAREPRLLILDEPTNGLDPAGIEEIRGLLVSLAEDGVTVMVSSHLLDEIDRMASVLGILGRGRLVFQGTRAELFDRSTPDLLVDTPEPGRALALGVPAVRSERGLRLSGLGDDDTAALVRRLVGADVPVHGVRRVQQSLEEVFMDLTGREGLL
ncbi:MULTISPECIES: ABC transporter ATP-binding protein [Nocardiopsis]|uniref:ABC transporter ATP-binding protein n=1 Tax=Nocardiopsis sinuspersici TaxID=501010 RepID=A0A1V3C410_9ACTN|nr:MULTISPECIES: ABC transporter ATP-binding protein [Nocardiopsis]NYH51966.1 ABC-2 type transport system ATP-binding protein [Nocardiopsis sinuspersici]OOC55527.1 ABC transporter ATP-binding protein [Nocardiopsis sinuspersici]